MAIDTLKLARLLSNHDATLVKSAALVTESTEKQAAANVAAIGMSHPRCAAIMVKQASTGANDGQIRRALEKAAAADPGVAKELASFCSAIGCRLEKRAETFWENLTNPSETLRYFGDKLQGMVPPKPSLIVPPPPTPTPAPASPAGSAGAGPASPAGPPPTEWYNNPLVWGGGALTAGWLANNRKRPQREEDK